MKQLILVLVLIVILILAVGLLPTPVSSDATRNQHLVITDVRLFDGQTMIEQATVVIENGHIVAAGPQVTFPDGASVINAAGHTLLPGLIDAHTHSFGGSRSDALRFGVTTVVDMFTPAESLPAAASQRDDMNQHALADMFSAGILATAEGGHGTQFGLPVATLSGPEDAADWVADRLTEGSDFIKIVIDSGRAYDRTMPTLDEATVTALVRATHAQDRLAMAHVATEEDALMALRAGVDGLVHLFHDRPASAEFLAAAADQGIFAVPTGIVMAGMTGATDAKALVEDPDMANRLSAEQQQTLTRPGWAPQLRQRIMPVLMGNIATLHEAGIPLLAGSDAPNPGTAHGISIHHEMALLVEAGLDPIEALRAATSLPARHFGLNQRGCLTVGCRADMVLVAGNPEVDIHTTVAIARVWKNGHEVTTRLVPDQGGHPARSATNLLDAAERGYWMASADDFQGGNSSARLADSDPNAPIRVRGQLAEGAATPFAGAMWMPGDYPMQATNLSDRQRLVIRLTGDDGPLQLLIFSGRGAPGMPLMTDLDSDEDGGALDLDLAQLGGIDLLHVQAIGVFAVGAPREVAFDIVEFRLD